VILSWRIDAAVVTRPAGTFADRGHEAIACHPSPVTRRQMLPCR
jgi:hypothetical protein